MKMKMKMKKTKKKKIKDLSSSSSSSKSTVSESSDLHAAVVKIAVAQICNSVGYEGAQTTALETLTGVAVRYLQSLATSAATSATSTGRTECNLLDVIRALEDLHSNVGFNGNSDLKRRLNTLTDSSILHNTMKFVYSTHEIPFAKPLPRRHHTIPSIPPCFSGESDKWKHIPRWLPDFPKIAVAGGETVVPAPIGGEIAWEKRFLTTESDRRINELPEKRKKVRFTIGDGGRKVIEMQCEVDLRGGICKGGKRISCQMYDDDEDFVNASCSSNHYVKPKIKSSLKNELKEQLKMSCN